MYALWETNISRTLVSPISCHCFSTKSWRSIWFSHKGTITPIYQSTSRRVAFLTTPSGSSPRTGCEWVSMIIRWMCVADTDGRIRTKWLGLNFQFSLVFLHIHRNCRFLGTGSPGWPPRLSHSSWTLIGLIQFSFMHTTRCGILPK